MRETLVQGRQLMGSLMSRCSMETRPSERSPDRAMAFAQSRSDRADDVPSSVEELGRHRVTETARRPNNEGGRRVPVRVSY